MKKGLAISSLLILLLSSTSVNALAAPNVLDKKFANCSALNKVYPGGVAKSRNVKNKGGKTNYSPTVNAKVYSENSGKDRDKDGIACEK
jgi:hypothetical protein